MMIVRVEFFSLVVLHANCVLPLAMVSISRVDLKVATLKGDLSFEDPWCNLMVEWYNSEIKGRIVYVLSKRNLQNSSSMQT